MGRDAREIAVIQAAYRLELDAQAWLNGVAEAARPFLDRGLGVATYTFDIANPSAMRVREAGGAGCAAEVVAGLQQLHTELAEHHTDELLAAYSHFLPTTISEVGASTMLEALPSLGATDMLGIAGIDVTCQGVGLAVLLDRPEKFPMRFLQRWNRLAVHLASGFRLRRFLTAHHAASELRHDSGEIPQSEEADQAGQVEAVIGPSHRIEHAEGPAKDKKHREALREAAVAIDRARATYGEAHVDHAIEAWRGLVEGRWSLVEHFEKDGRRYLIARRNDPQLPFPDALDQRERQVLVFRALGHPLKMIAYELGLSINGVARTLARAKRKLGVTSDVDLALLFPSS